MFEVFKGIILSIVLFAAGLIMVRNPDLLWFMRTRHRLRESYGSIVMTGVVFIVLAAVYFIYNIVYFLKM